MSSHFQLVILLVTIKILVQLFFQLIYYHPYEFISSHFLFQSFLVLVFIVISFLQSHPFAFILLSTFIIFIFFHQFIFVTPFTSVFAFTFYHYSPMSSEIFHFIIFTIFYFKMEFSISYLFIYFLYCCFDPFHILLVNFLLCLNGRKFLIAVNCVFKFEFGHLAFMRLRLFISPFNLFLI